MLRLYERNDALGPLQTFLRITQFLYMELGIAVVMHSTWTSNSDEHNSDPECPRLLQFVLRTLGSFGIVCWCLRTLEQKQRAVCSMLRLS